MENLLQKSSLHPYKSLSTEDVVTEILKHKDEFVPNYKDVLVKHLLDDSKIFVTLNEAAASQLTLELETL